MAERGEIVTVYVAGVVQGVALVTFPAASAVFTDAGGYALSSTEYGGMFVPQAVMAITASWLGAGLTRRLGAKRIYLVGLLANLAAMVLLVVSRFVMREHALAYGSLLVATACLGIGFGCTVPTLNTFAAAFFPQRVDQAVLQMNALLGVGTALAPVLVAVFVGLGFWWGLPVLSGALLAGLVWSSARLPLRTGVVVGGEDTAPARGDLPSRFWMFAGFAFLYGVCETMNGNWASLYVTQELGASATEASLVLTVFWAMLTTGRLLFSAVGRWLPARVVFRGLPWVVAVACVATAELGSSAPRLALPVFALAGLGCSALLPLVISFGQAELTGMAASVAGGLIAAYQIGYGLAAFGVGPLHTRAGLDLHVLYGGTTVVALVLAICAVLIVRRPVHLAAPTRAAQLALAKEDP